MAAILTENRRKVEMGEQTFIDDGKHYANKKLSGLSFAGRDLSNADFRGAEVIECDFTGCNLSCAKFMESNCWGANFTKARLYKANFTRAIMVKANFHAADLRNMVITLGCDTFEDIKMSKKWMNGLLFMISLADIPVETQQKLHEIIGEDEVRIWQAARMTL